MKKYIADGGINATLAHVYGDAAVEAQKARYSKAIDEFAAIYGADRQITLYSVAGRSELSGNHTDHNHGCVVAASIDLDIIAVASAREDSVIRVKLISLLTLLPLKLSSAPPHLSSQVCAQALRRTATLSADLMHTPPLTFSRARDFLPPRRLRI